MQGRVADCRSRGPEFDPDPVPYFRGDNLRSADSRKIVVSNYMRKYVHEVLVNRLVKLA